MDAHIWMLQYQTASSCTRSQRQMSQFIIVYFVPVTVVARHVGADKLDGFIISETLMLAYSIACSWWYITQLKVFIIGWHFYSKAASVLIWQNPFVQWNAWYVIPLTEFLIQSTISDDIKVSELLNLQCYIIVTVRWQVAIASCCPGRRLTGRALAGPQEQEGPGSVSQREALPARLMWSGAWWEFGQRISVVVSETAVGQGVCMNTPPMSLQPCSLSVWPLWS